MPPWHRPSGSTGASAPLRFPGPARPERHAPAEPIPGYARRRTATPRLGGTGIRGAAACRHFRRARAGFTAWKGAEGRRKAQKHGPPGMPDADGQQKGQQPFHRSGKSCILNTLRRTRGGPCGSRFTDSAGARRPHHRGLPLATESPPLPVHPLSQALPTISIAKLYHALSACASLAFRAFRAGRRNASGSWMGGTRTRPRSCPELPGPSRPIEILRACAQAIPPPAAPGQAARSPSRPARAQRRWRNRFPASSIRARGLRARSR